MRLAIVLTAAMGLSGCIASNTVVRSQAMSFDDIIEDTTDKLLVLKKPFEMIEVKPFVGKQRTDVEVSYFKDAETVRPIEGNHPA